MAGGTGFGWTLFGTLLCGLIFTIPFIVGFYIYKFIQSSVDRRKEETEKESEAAHLI